MNRFLHRERELNGLTHLTRREGPALILVYGRRRVGKTTLLQHWAEQSGLPFFYWMAPRTTAENVRSDLVRELWRWSTPGEVETAPRYDNWNDVFRALRRVVGDRRMVVVLDEFPWAVESDRSLPSRLQWAWDQVFHDSQIKLIISGSHISALEGLLRSDAPLFGRMTGKLYVPPFHFPEITPFIQRYSAEKRLAVYAMVGGIPDYLRQWDDQADLLTNIREIFLSDLSPYRNETEVLISDILRRDSPDYEAVLGAVAQGQRDLAAIADATVLSSDRAAAVVSILIELRLVEKRIRASTPLERHDKARYARYYLADPFLRFYYRFVEPHRIYLARQKLEPVMQALQTQLRSFVAETFEDLCRQWTWDQGLAGQLPFVPEFVGSDWRGGTLQADVVAVNWRDAQVLVGEAKWGDQNVALPIYTALAERAQKLVRYMPNKKPWTIHLAVFARKGFTPPVHTLAREQGSVLVSFNQLVKDLGID